MVPPREPPKPPADDSRAMPKVGELYIARVVDEHVGGLNVQVEYAVTVGEGERLAQGIGNSRGLVKGK